MSRSTALTIGESIPHFTLKDQDNKEFDITTVLGSKPCVIYFYPKDNTPGCTAEACEFRDNISLFRDLDAIVIGISSDSVESHKRFAEKFNLPFTLLSDENQKVRNLFGVKSDFFGLIDSRITFVADEKGIIRHIFKSQLTPKKHVSEALEALSQ